MSEWEQFKITFASDGAPKQDKASELETVYHVVHVPVARRILEDGRLKAGLVYDESCLRTSRIAVTWVSANTWGPGSIYGNVQFSFPWKSLVAGRQFYWVEVMEEYNPCAYRILLTERDLSGSKKVRPYDPKTDLGPLRERNGKWFWLGGYTSEFMIEADVPFDECTEFDFISHNRDHCRPHGKKCPDMKANVYRTGGRVLAFLLGNDVHKLDHVLKPGKMLSDAVSIGVSGIDKALGKANFRGVIHRPGSSLALVRGALALYGSDQGKQAHALLALLKSADVFETALYKLALRYSELDAAGLVGSGLLSPMLSETHGQNI